MQGEIVHSQIGPRDGCGYHARMDLTLNIRAIRKDRGLTIAQLAERIGVSTAHLSQVERGVKNVNNHLLTRIAEALRVPPSTLIANQTDQDTLALSLLIDRLSPADRERVRAFAEALMLSPKG